MPISPSDLYLSEITEEDFDEWLNQDPTSLRVDTLSADSADLEMTFKIPGDKLKAAIQWVLGVDYVGPDNKLHRTLPMFHPVHVWTWARSMKIRGIGPDGADTDAVEYMYQTTPEKWKSYEVVVSFEYPKYEIWEDSDIDYEYERYVSKHMSPSVKLVSIDGGQLVYDVPGSVSPHGNIHYGLVPITRRESAGYTMTWHKVPLEYVQENDDSIPVKLLQAQGCVNNATFFGQPAETMLLQEVKLLRKYVSPVSTDSANGFYWLYDIEFTFEFLKQLSSQVNLGTTTETRRGHNLWLGPGNKYYYAKNSASGLPVYPPVDMKKLFTIWSDSL